MWNLIRAVVVVAALCSLAGCAGLPVASSPSPSPVAWLVERIAGLDGVLTADAFSSDENLTVEIAEDADDVTVLATARAVHGLATAASWPGTVTLRRAAAGLNPATDVPAPSAWTQKVYPGDFESIEEVLALLLAVEKLPDVASIAFSPDGWPSVQLSSLDTFTARFRTLSALPAFADGATYAYYGEVPMLVVVHIPERMSAESVEAVIRIAVENPESEVELQSLTTPGNRWPELWVARLTEEQRVRVDAQLRDPALADADPEGYSIPFQLSVLGPNGPELSWGTFGDVPDTSS